MPAAEFIAETFLRVIVESVLYGLSYFTGACVLALVTLGQISLAPFSSLHERNRNKKLWNDWSIWLHRPMQKKALRAEAICAVGFFTWIALGLAAYYVTKSDENPKANKSVEATGVQPVPEL